MSQYISFYLRCEDKFLPLMSFSRSTTLYQAFNDTYVPYGTIKPVTQHQLMLVTESLSNSESNMRQILARREEEKALIPSFNNSTNEKLGAIEDLNESIDEINEELECIAAAKNTVGVLSDILDEAKYHKDEASISGCSEDNYLFVGIESPTWPTIEDIGQPPTT